MVRKNRNLHAAKAVKNDEFYTRLEDIENELRYYKEHFKGKTVYCNCDDPKVSNFFKYFSLNFEYLGLKKLIASCYRNVDAGKPTDGLSDKAVWLEYTGEKGNGTVPTDANILVHEFEGDGDFRSEESIELLKQADIVVTNPPFSLFREYVAQLMEYDKQFVIMGSMNAITYKEIFPLLRDNKMWLGHKNGSMSFVLPEHAELKASGYINENGQKIQKFGNIAWYTNLDIAKRHEDLILFKTYHPDEYPMYYNFDGINVDKVTNIPADYDGIMGVPITFLDKHSHAQFDIIGLGIANLGLDVGVRPYTSEHREYRKTIQKRGVVDGDLYMVHDDVVKVPYARILIKHKK